MSGYVDLHLHYVPGVDDGVRTRDDALAMLRGLRSLGYARSIATPHIRRDLFPNEREPLVAAFDAFTASVAAEAGLPELGLGAEHWVDETLLPRVKDGRAIPYPGARAILIEIPPAAIPIGFENVCFRIRTRGLVPVLAHPERYAPLYEKTTAIEPLLEQGMATLLDLMSLVGRYGRAPQRAAERMLDEGAYDAACSDAHGPGDVAHVERALVVLDRRVGRDEAERLLRTGPSSILAGAIDR